MDRFDLHILGCGSALPTTKHALSSQVVNLRDKLYMIDCGEGTQLQFRKTKLNFNRLNHIFISHLHGDHCFGLPGLIATLSLLGRTSELVIHAHSDAERIMRPYLDYFSREMSYKVRFDSINPGAHSLIFEDRTVRVYSIPLKHRIPTCGFLFEETPKKAHIIRDMIDFHHVPISLINRIKEGDDYLTHEGTIIPNSVFTRPAVPPKRYAYCSDTAYSEKIIDLIDGVDLLYHEATFAQSDIVRAKETYHSSPRQAAEIALKAHVKRLMIGHFSARYPEEDVLLEEAKAVFPDTIAAKELLCVEV